MNMTDTFWRDLLLVMLAILVLALIGGAVEWSANLILGTGG